MTFSPETDVLWSVEHGEVGDDVNLIKPGRNYGWRIITYDTEYDLRPINGRRRTAAPGMEQPVYHSDPAIW